MNTACVRNGLVRAKRSSPIPGIANNTTAIQIITPNPGQLTPTPTFPPFTVGTWPSNYSPNNKDSITIYVFCRVQPSDMAGPSKPPNSLQVTVQVLDPVNKQFTGNTDNDGLAAVPITFDDQQSGKPVVVTAKKNRVRVKLVAVGGGSKPNDHTNTNTTPPGIDCSTSIKDPKNKKCIAQYCAGHADDLRCDAE